MSPDYNPPLSLTVIGTIFIGLAALVSAWITWDICVRRGWRSMMGIMLPVYILNALYLAPITLWTYLNYGRPMSPAVLTEWIKEMKDGSGMTGHMHMMHQESMHEDKEGPEKNHSHGGHEGHGTVTGSNDVGGQSHMNHEDHVHRMRMEKELENGQDDSGHNREAHAMSGYDHLHREGHSHHMGMETEEKSSILPSKNYQGGYAMTGHDQVNHIDMENGKVAPSHDHAGHMQHGAGEHNMAHMNPNMANDPHMFHMMEDRPMFATVTVAVCHCGAGCLLGDIVGEWLVYGTNAQIDGRMMWPEFLIDYAFALLFGIVFQYFSIAPMSGEYGPKTIYRAAKADFLSLTFFEIGLFGWMAIFQVAIFDWKLQTNSVVYWWMMQIGMFLGHWTAFPINWWLITSGIKEPCA